MDSIVKLKRFGLFLGDLATLYLALFLMLFLRYGEFSSDVVRFHFAPFSIIFAIWLIIFYIGDLYDLRLLKNNGEFFIRFIITVGLSGILAVMFFYFIPDFIIAPKTNLFSFIGIFAVLGYAWRQLYNYMLNNRLSVVRILLTGYNRTTEEIYRQLERNPQLGYSVAFWMKEGMEEKNPQMLAEIIKRQKIDVVVLPAHLKKNPRVAHVAYGTLALGVEVIDLATLYEKIFRKIPVAELEESWFLGNLVQNHRIYDSLKRPVEIVFVLGLGVLLLPLIILIALIIKITSPGSAIFRQVRIGYRDESFTIFKFRTMRLDAEKNGPQWAAQKDDRSTRFGHFLRRTHLDELPQLLNVLNGTISLVGPRPERPEFVAKLKQEILYYELRHLVRPGVTGWAQTHYRYGASINDAYEKLQYELYYIRHRSFMLDIITLLKTVKFFFTNF